MKARPRLLVPVDFTPASNAAEKYAEWLAEKTGGEITLLHAWQMPLVAGPKLLIYGGDSRESLEGWLRHNRRYRLDQAKASARPGTLAMLVQGEPRRTIVDAAATGFDLIVMGTRGRAFGSVASHVARASPIPVLIIPEAV